VIKYNKTV